MLKIFKSGINLSGFFSLIVVMTFLSASRPYNVICKIYGSFRTPSLIPSSTNYMVRIKEGRMRVCELPDPTDSQHN